MGGHHMLNVVWIAMIFISILVGVLNGTLNDVVQAIPEYAKLSFNIALGLVGIMTFWLGLARIAEDSGLMIGIARLLKPIMTRLFPDVPPEHPAMGSMMMNISANMLGLANAATPFGLKAMQELEALNQRPGVATNAMCTFLAINTSSVQLIPATAIAYLTAAGSQHPTIVIATGLVATSCSTLAAIFFVKFFQNRSSFKLASLEGQS